MIAIPLLAALLIGAPQDSSATALPPAASVVPRRLTPQQEEQLKQNLEQARIRHEPERQAAMHINDLAGNIHSEADARKLVDAVAEQLTHHRHLLWAAQSIRRRVAHAEYESVSDPSQLIPEQRMVDVWNEYVREIDAPDEALITVADLHNLRSMDVQYSQHNWKLDITQSIWSMPNIYALDAGGNLADGCRALEALKTIRNLHDQFSRVQFARQRLQREPLVTSSLEQPQESGVVTARVFTGRVASTVMVQDPIRPAVAGYRQEHGGRAYDQLVRRLFNELLPAD